MKDVEMTPQTQRPNPMLRQQSKYEKLDKTKFFKHYMPDDSFFEQKNRDFNFKEWIHNKFTVAFEENLLLGAIGDLPTSLKYLLGTLGYMLLMAFFLYFLIDGYVKTKNARFMSLDPNSGDCTEVPVSITQNVYADYEGVWNGDNSFRAQDAIYQLTVTNFQRSTKQYEDFMAELLVALEVRAAFALHSGSANNLLVWMSWRKKGRDYNFQMTGNTRVVFNRQHRQVSISSRGGVCGLTGVHGFNHGAGTLYVQYSYPSYVADDNCKGAWATENQGYIAAIDGPLLQNEFDVTSMITAIAVNTNIVSTNDLLSVNTSINLPIQIFEFVDEGSPFMYPITCSRDNFCFLIYNKVFMFPIFFHYGETMYEGVNDTRVPLSTCSCPLAAGTASSCNSMDFIVGFIFYDTVAFEPMQELLVTFRGNYESIISAAYNAAVASLNNNKPFDESNYDFCTLSYGPCSMIVFNVFDEEKAVSPFYHVLPESACVDTFTTTNWHKLVSNPPFLLVQDYYECTTSTNDAIIDSLGIAVGNASFWAPLLLTLTLPAMYLFLNYYKDAPSSKLEYNDDEMEEAARHIGLLLLRVRDGKFQSYEANLVEHYMTILEALRAPPMIATDTQIKRLRKEIISAQRRTSVVEDPNDSDAEIDPLEDIANAGNHPSGKQAYYAQYQRDSISKAGSGGLMQRRGSQSPEAQI